MQRLPIYRVGILVKTAYIVEYNISIVAEIMAMLISAGVLGLSYYMPIGWGGFLVL